MLAATLPCLGMVALQPVEAATAASPSVLVNGTFASGKTGWTADNDATSFTTTDTTRAGRAAKLTASTGRAALRNLGDDTLHPAGTTYTATAWVRATKPGATARLAVTEAKPKVKDRRTITEKRLSDTAWHRLQVAVKVQASGSDLRFRVRATGMAASSALLVDDAALARTATAAPAPNAARTLSNGCELSARGIPSCGALMGGAYQANGDPAPWESYLGGHLGVHRLFFGAGSVSGAVKHASASLAKGRLPWVSFKVPYSWKDMANGKGDAWAKDIAQRFSKLNGPVWVAFHHEPENDGGDVLDWKRMQERLGPIVRANASNVAFTAIVMGYHQFYGDDKFAMSRMWPQTKVDLAGFDIYDDYGKNGRKVHVDMGAYFDKAQAWSKSSGVPWGLAETGISNAGAADYPGWFQDSYSKLVAKGGKAFAYFNTPLNSIQDYSLSTSLKMEKYRAVFRTAPSM